MSASKKRAINARIRFLKKSLKELEKTFSLAIDRSSFTPAVAAKGKALLVHEELQQALRDKEKIEENEARPPEEGEALAAILEILPGLPLAVLEEIKNAIDRLL